MHLHLESTGFFYNFTQKCVILRGAVRVIERQFLERIRVEKERMRILRDNWIGEVGKF
jgi:hypothetical protein